MSIRKVKDESDLINLLSRSSDVFVYFRTTSRGRPPKVHREHVEAIAILCKTLIDDIYKCMDYMLPDASQIRDLLRAFEYLNSIKRRYINKINYLEKYGVIPPQKEKEDDS